MPFHPRMAPFWEYVPVHINALSLAINTTPTLTIYAGTQTITPTSISGVVAGQLFTFSGGTGASENVAVASLTTADFSGIFVNGHSGAYTVVATPISTTASPAITTGSNIVTPASMVGIVNGISLHFAAGGGTAEDVVVTAVTATTFTATFAFTHTNGTAITLGTASNLTLTPTTNIGVAGSKTIAVASQANITVGTLLHISAGTGTAEDVSVTALPTANTITATFANIHSSTWTITTPTAMTYIPVGNGINTTSATSITAGSDVTVTPANISGFATGIRINVANGTGTAETTTVKAVNVSAGTFRADFANNHSGAYTISSVSGTFLGSVVINQVGSSITITLWNGNPNVVPLPAKSGVIAVLTPAAIGNPGHAGLCQYGLFYSVTGTTAGDYTLWVADAQPA